MTNTNTILIIDDEPDILELLEITLIRMGHNCLKANSYKQAIEQLESENIKLCLTDMNLNDSDGTGLNIIEYVQEHHSNIPIAMITAYGNTETAIDALKAGAFDYVSKPIDLPKLKSLIAAGLKTTGQKPVTEGQHSKLLGNSKAMEQLRNTTAKLARSLAPVFINGESGSGKELVARTIHQQSPRSNAPFIAVNCGAIPSELMESEFFGHEKGSFTGANEKKIGLFQAAEGGTLFLDEVADLPTSMQVKLLRAIQEKSIRPIGSVKEIVTDIRILSATHKNLAQAVENNLFRQDLFYRINVIELTVPPLRERKEDIALLADYILNMLSQRYDSTLATLSDSARAELQAYDFPGNVRELENTLERALALCEDNIIENDDLQLEKSDTGETKQINQKSSEGISIQQAFGDLEGFLEDLEREAINSALEQTRWNKTAAAELLGISFRTIRYKIKKYNIE